MGLGRVDGVGGMAATGGQSLHMKQIKQNKAKQTYISLYIYIYNMCIYIYIYIYTDLFFSLSLSIYLSLSLYIYIYTHKQALASSRAHLPLRAMGTAIGSPKRILS